MPITSILCYIFILPLQSYIALWLGIKLLQQWIKSISFLFYHFIGFLGMILSRASQVLARRMTRGQVRGFMSRSSPRLGHNLEDFYLWPEYNAAMVNPMFEYAFTTTLCLVGILSVWPLMHTNYYFSGRFLPKDPESTLLDDSW